MTDSLAILSTKAVVGQLWNYEGETTLAKELLQDVHNHHMLSSIIYCEFWARKRFQHSYTHYLAFLSPYPAIVSLISTLVVYLLVMFLVHCLCQLECKPHEGRGSVGVLCKFYFPMPFKFPEQICHGVGSPTFVKWKNLVDENSVFEKNLLK